METGYPQGQPRQERHKHHDPPHEECDLTGMDDLACESRGVADRAQYIAKYADALKERRAMYDTARAAYTQARTAATAETVGIRKDLLQIREQLRCQLDRDTVECLDEAWDEVAERLRHCGEGRSGCCVEECDFEDEDGAHDDIEDLTARLGRVERVVSAAESCFTTLVGEPDELARRVADLRARATALIAEISDPKKADLKHAYATLRWLWHRYDEIWWGFPRVDDFQNCLCRALTCSIGGRRLLGILTGRLGVLKCRKDARDQRCAMLRARVVETVLEVCDRSCHSVGDAERAGQEKRTGPRTVDEAEQEADDDADGETGAGDSAETTQTGKRGGRPHSTW